MKKILIVALLVISFSSFAQEQTDKKSNRQKKEKMSPEQRNQALLDRMTTELTLTVPQQEQIKPIIAEQSAKLEIMRAERMSGDSKKMTTEEREAFKTKRKEDKKATDAKLQTILTPAQFKKMKENEAATREKMREARQNGSWGENGNNGGNRDENREDN